MKLFDLEEALAGAPVCTRDGRPVEQLAKFDVSSSFVRVAGVMNYHHVGIWSAGGLDCIFGDSQNDLFMAPVKKTGWIARHRYSQVNGSYIGGFIFDSEDGAKAGEPNASSYHQIEWEE
jgi:hypothetical protein